MGSNWDMDSSSVYHEFAICEFVISGVDCIPVRAPLGHSTQGYLRPTAQRDHGGGAVRCSAIKSRNEVHRRQFGPGHKCGPGRYFG